MGNLNDWNIAKSFCKDEDFRKCNNEIANLMNKKLDDLSLKEVNRLIYLHEMMSISYRKYLQMTTNISYDEAIMFQKFRNRVTEKDDKSMSNLPVSVANFATEFGQGLYCKTPLTFRRNLSYSFNLANYLKIALKEYEYKNEISLLNLNKKFVVYAIRCDEKFNHMKHCDNDNMELSEMINVIFSFLGSSDNPLKMTLFSDFFVTNESDLWGLHLCVLPYDMAIMKGKELLKYIQRKITK